MMVKKVKEVLPSMLSFQSPCFDPKMPENDARSSDICCQFFACPRRQVLVQFLLEMLMSSLTSCYFSVNLLFLNTYANNEMDLLFWSEMINLSDCL